MNNVVRTSLMAIGLLALLLTFAGAGSTALRDEPLKIKVIKYEIASTDEESVSLVVIAIVTNGTDFDYGFDLWIDVLSAKNVKIGQVRFDGVDGEAHSDKELSEKIKVPAKEFSEPLKLKSQFRNVKEKR